MIAWLLTYAVHSTVLLGAVLIADRRLLRRPGIREHAWKMAAFGAVFSASLQLAVLQHRPDAAPVSGRWEIPARTVARAPAQQAMLNATVSMPPASSATNSVSAPRDWRATLFFIWLAASFASALRNVLLRRAVRRYVGPRTSLRDHPLNAAVRELAPHTNIFLTTCDRNISPMVIGRREICIPRPLLDKLSTDQQRSVLAHEVSHITRHDPEWVIAFAMLEIALPFQPLNWMARRRVRECAEYLCDSRAVALMATPLPLARTLVDVASWLRPDMIEVPYPAMAGNRNLLASRVDRLLSGVVERTPAWTPLAGLAAIIAVMVIAPAITGAQERTAKQQGDKLDIPTFQFHGNMSDADKLAAAYNDWRRAGADKVAAYVKRAGDATVRFTYEPRDGVCGTGVEKDRSRMIALQPTHEWQPGGSTDRLALFVTNAHGGMTNNTVGVDGRWTTPCQAAAARVDLHGNNVDLTVGSPAPEIVGRLIDAGKIPAPVASAYLMRFAANETALLAAVIAKGVITEDLYALIGDFNTPREVKSSAKMWIGMFERSDYDRVPDRAHRVEMIESMAKHRDAAVDRKLNDIVQNAHVVEEQDAALKALMGTSTLASETVMRLVLDPRQPLETRKKALVWAGTHGVSRDLVKSVVDSVESAELRGFMKEWLRKSAGPSN